LNSASDRRARHPTVYAVLLVASAILFPPTTVASVTETVSVDVVVIATSSNRPSAEPPILRFKCSGVAINANTVSTAAHCVNDPAGFVIAAGGNDICEGTWAYYPVRQVVELDLETDLAIIETTTLKLSPTDVRLPFGASAAVGWQQQTRTGPIQCGLQIAPLSGMPCTENASGGSQCFRSNGSVGVCQGMSGAPIFQDGQLTAIVSASDSCGEALVQAATVSADNGHPS